MKYVEVNSKYVAVLAQLCGVPSREEFIFLRNIPTLADMSSLYVCDGSETMSCFGRSTSKASYIAYRRERDRGLPNFEGSYKRTMSPSERPESLVDTPASSPVPECDRLSMDRESSASGASLEETSLRSAGCLPPPPPPRANSLESCSEQSSPNLELARGGGVDASPPPSLLVMERLEASVVLGGLSGLATLDRKKQHRNNLRNQQLQQQQQQASARVSSPEAKKPPAPEPKKAASPRSVETETQCDLRVEGKGKARPASPPSAPSPPSAVASSPPSPATAAAPPAPRLATTITASSTAVATLCAAPGEPKVTESLQLVQRSEVVLRVNAATSDAASQTEAERDASPPPPASPSATAPSSTPAPTPAAAPAPATPPATPTATTAAASPPPPAESGTGAAVPPAPLLVRPKTQEELDCERLSLDLASQLPPTDKLQTLLVPDPEHKKPTDYVSGLFRLDVTLRPRPALAPSLRNSNNNNSSTDSSSEQGGEDIKKEDTPSSVSPLPANSKYFTISESKAKFLNRYVRDIGQMNGVHDNKDLHQKKEELVTRLDRKLEVLRSERLLVSEESRVNEELGSSVAAQVSRLAHPHEAAKYRLHVEEVGKITSLLLALSGRLARAENALMGLPLNHAERKILESKRDKLREQLEEAKKLKENIDRRSISVSNILYKYFNSEEYADYDHFINMKAKLIMDSREIADKIKLGEEQLAALRETLYTPND